MKCLFILAWVESHVEAIREHKHNAQRKPVMEPSNGISKRILQSLNNHDSWKSMSMQHH